jgi:hypothetical protein
MTTHIQAKGYTLTDEVLNETLGNFKGTPGVPMKE